MTKINKLLMHGFKSFAKRTELVFGDEFNCIVGPNGSGKSNVLDALCFVLGKTSAKSMRAEKSTNLIYNGGKTKKPATSAEVSIFFDNSKGTFPTEEQEVKVSRIVKSNGNSVYKINDKTRTRSQVVELLSLAKINPNGYNIILQGDIVKFVEMSPNDRRKLIEEISGIGMYDAKKHQAENELNKVEERLKEANIILKERENNLKELKKEKNQAEKYKDLNNKISTNKATLLHRKISGKDGLKKEFDEKIEKENKKIEEIRKKIDEAKKKIAERKNKIEEINKEIEQKSEKDQLDIHKKVETIKVNLATSKNKLESYKNELSKTKIRSEQLKSDLENINSKIKEAKEKQKTQQDKKKEKESQIKQLDAKLKEFREKHDLDSAENLENEIVEIDRSMESLQKEIQELRQKQQDFLRETDKIEILINSIDEKIDRVKQIEKENKEQIEELKQKRVRFKKATLELNKLINDDTSYSSQLSNARRKMMDVNEELAKLRAKNAGIQEKIFGNVALKEISKQKRNIPGIYGTVSELGKVESKYSLALEVAAGNKIKDIVVENETVAIRCINFLKERKLGTVTFLPLNKIKPKDEGKSDLYRNHEGVIGKAIELINFDPKLKNVFSYVFGSTLVVKNINVTKKIGIGTAKMVTLDGDAVESSGAMRGGYKQARKGIGFSEKEISEKIDRCESERDDIEALITSLENRKETNEQKISELREEKANLEADMIKLEKTLHLDTDDLEASKKRKEELFKEKNETDKKLDEMQRKISTLNNELAKHKIRKEQIRQKITQLKNPTLIAELNAFEEKRKILNEEIIKIGSELASYENQVGKMLETEKNNITKVTDQTRQEKEKIEEEIKITDKEIKEMNLDLKEKEKKEKEFMQQFKGLFTEREKNQKEVNQTETVLDKENELLREKEQKLNTYSLQNAQIKAELSSMQEEFKQYEGVPLDHKKSDSDIKREISQFERFVENLGAVNMKALEIYESVEKEYQKLNEKREKLTSEKTDVLELINEIETKKIEIFLKTFDIVTENFKNFFNQLTTKGEANLLLENQENPLEGGVYIKVKMSGNRFMDIRSLSGGEKTMTALAFIFAIQEHDPASFIIMDEVDAALDKKNAEKLVHLVNKYSERAQYIIISHNDIVITSSNNIYGVSMDEHGISKVLSMKM